MTPSEIIKADAQRGQYDADIVLRKIDKLAQSGKAIIFHENNSILVLIALPGGNAELHLYTADSPLTMAQSLKKFISKIRASDIKKVYGSGDIPQTLELLKKLGVDVQQSDDQRYRWMAPV
jgi:phosphomannomutase